MPVAPRRSAEARAAHRLNRLAELSGWDHELLAIEFEEIIALDLTLDLCEFIKGSGEMSPIEFTRFLADFLHCATKAVRAGAMHYVFTDWRHMRELLDGGAASGLELKNLCVWNKGAGAMGSFYRSQHELVFAFKAPGAAHVNNDQLGIHTRAAARRDALGPRR